MTSRAPAPALSRNERGVQVPPPVPFTEEDATRAFEAWGCNCGPGALAGVLGMTLDDVRPHLGDFESKGYTNPTLMYAALDSIRVTFQRIPQKHPGVQVWPAYGLVRVQWEGPWTEPRVPMRARYRYSHWIGTALVGSRGVFDINCMNNGTGWVSVDDWSREIVPHLVADYAKATGGWHLANALEVVKPRV